MNKCNNYIMFYQNEERQTALATYTYLAIVHVHTLSWHVSMRLNSLLS